MTSPKHLWSGDWEHESRAAEPTRPLAPPPVQERPPPPEEPPPPRRANYARRRVLMLGAVAVLAVAGTVWALTSSSSNNNLTSSTTAGPAAHTPTATTPFGLAPQPQTSTAPNQQPGTATAPASPPTGAQADALGLNLASVPVDRVIVQSVEPGSPADQVGIGAGDLLLSINGMKVTSPDQANGIIAKIPKGSQVTLELVQGSEQIQATIQESNGP